MFTKHLMIKFRTLYETLSQEHHLFVQPSNFNHDLVVLNKLLESPYNICHCKYQGTPHDVPGECHASQYRMTSIFRQNNVRF